MEYLSDSQVQNESDHEMDGIEDTQNNVNNKQEIVIEK
jgi:hypothetical protein